MTERKKTVWLDVLPLVFSGVALAFSIITYTSTTKDQKDMQAYSFWHDYLKIAVENPDLALGIYAKKDTAQEHKYEFFLVNALNVAERVYELQADDTAWRASIKHIIWHHRCYIHNHPNMIQGYYGHNFEALIHEAVDTADFKNCQ